MNASSKSGVDSPFSRSVERWSPRATCFIAASLDWREVAILRAYARYLKQIRFGLSQLYIANTLTSYPEITRELIRLFTLRFDPQKRPSAMRAPRCRRGDG